MSRKARLEEILCLQSSSDSFPLSSPSGPSRKPSDHRPTLPKVASRSVFTFDNADCGDEDDSADGIQDEMPDELGDADIILNRFQVLEECISFADACSENLDLAQLALVER